jgi:ABC-type antimicrobial peptide transport system permease subunit
MLGVFSTTAFAVARRTHEIGVRMAFGARHTQVAGAVVGDAAWPVGIGVVAGLAGALAVTRVIRSLLFETEPTDPLALAAAAVVLAAAALLAAWIPARRAARVDPCTALRAD